MDKLINQDTTNIMIVIPLYNHSATVHEVAKRCLKFHDQVLVVDDGSIDLRQDTFKDLDIKLIKHPKNMGKGAAILTAAKEATKLGISHIITIDADLQHIPEDIPKFKAAIEKDSSAIYVGKRDFLLPGIPVSSNLGRKFSNFWYRVQTGKKIGDAQSGFRAYPVYVLNALNLSDKHYSFEVEVLVKATWARVPIKDIDICVYYPEKDQRVSHFKLFKDNLRLTHLNTRLTLRSFLPIPHKQILGDAKEELKFSIFSPLKSIHLFISMNVSPYRIALSGAVGIFLGTLPLIGVHTLIILFISGFFRLNKAVSVGVSQFCMPPFVPAFCIEAGYFLCHDGKFLTDISLKTLGSECLQRVYEWFIGSLIVAPVLSVIAFLIIYIIAKSVKEFSGFITETTKSI